MNSKVFYFENEKEEWKKKKNDKNSKIFNEMNWLRHFEELKDYIEKPISFRTFVSDFLKEELEIPQLEEAENVLVNGEIWNWERDKNLFVWLWGKGSGKGTLAVDLELYAFYSLLLMKSPQKFFRMLSNDEIAFVNVALSGDQSRVNIFDRFVSRLRNLEYILDNYEVYYRGRRISSGKRDRIVISNKMVEVLDRNIRIYSEHSEYEHWEGKNIVFFVLDEYSGAKTQVELEWAKGILNSLITSNREMPFIGIVMSYMRLDPEFDATYQLVEKVRKGEVSKAYASIRFPWELRPKKYEGEFFIYKDRNEENYLVPISLKQQFEIDEDSARRKYLNIAGRKSETGIFFDIPEKAEECVIKDRRDAIDYIEEFIQVDKERYFYRLRVNSVRLPPEYFYVIAIDKGEKSSDTALSVAHKVRIKVGEEVVDKVIIDATLVWSPQKELNVTVDTDNVSEVVLNILKHLRKDRVVVRIDHWQSSDLVNRCLKLGYRAVQKNASLKGYELLKRLIENNLMEFPDTEVTHKGILQIKYLRDRGASKPRVSVGKQDIVDVWAEVCEELMERQEIVLPKGKLLVKPVAQGVVEQRSMKEVEDFFIRSPSWRFPVGKVITLDLIKRRFKGE